MPTASCAPRRGSCPLKALAQYIREDELHQSFNFEYLMTPWLAADQRATITHSLAQAEAVGAPQTWVLSNHDVVRHATRLGYPQKPGLQKIEGIGAGRPSAGRRTRSASRPGRHSRHVGAARLCLPVPGRGAGPPGGNAAARPGPARIRPLRAPMARPQAATAAAYPCHGRAACRHTVSVPATSRGSPSRLSTDCSRPTANATSPESTLELYTRLLAVRRELRTRAWGTNVAGRAPGGRPGVHGEVRGRFGDSPGQPGRRAPPLPDRATILAAQRAARIRAATRHRPDRLVADLNLSRLRSPQEAVTFDASL